jgi:hypothetical protein
MRPSREPAQAAETRRKARRHLFQGDNRLRRDIGLPPLDRHGLPM